MRAGTRAFVPEYRLAPEHPFPAADDEVLLDDSRRYVERAVADGVDARRTVTEKFSNERGVFPFEAHADHRGDRYSCSARAIGTTHASR